MINLASYMHIQVHQLPTPESAELPVLYMPSLIPAALVSLSHQSLQIKLRFQGDGIVNNGNILTIGTPSMLQATLLKSIGWSSNKGIPSTPSGSDVSSLVISAATVSCYI